MSVAAVILIIALQKNIKEIFDRKFLENIAKIVLSSGILLIITTLIYYIIQNNPFESETAENILVAVIVFIWGACVYIGVNILCKTDETNALMKMLKKK